MRTIVTGGSGFVGKELIGSLMSKGHEVVNLDLVPSGIDGIEEHICDLSKKKRLMSRLISASI